MRQPFYSRGAQLDGRIRKVFQNKLDSSHRHTLKLMLKCKISMVAKNLPLTLKRKLSRENLRFSGNFQENENLL
jgi:hypothetical protein